MKRSINALMDILESIHRIETYLDSVDYDTFLANQMLLDAVVRNLEIIGEAARNLSDEVKMKYHEVPWRNMIGLYRNLENSGLEIKNFTFKRIEDYCFGSGSLFVFTEARCVKVVNKGILERRKRPLGIPTMRDRIVQMATKLILGPIFEADFQKCSFCNRKGNWVIS